MSSTPPPGHPQQYRADIDGLRSIAIISVLLFHLFPQQLRGGFIGVDVFFVISGFLITGILVKQERFSIQQFYVRRVKRIFPALAAVLAACLVLGWWLLHPEEYRALGKHVFAGAAFSANVALYRESGYFDTLSETKPLLHLWSLGVEEQYYVVWPLLVAALRRRPRVLVATTLLLMAASLLTSVWLTGVSPSAAFYLPASRFWELSCGALLATQQKLWPASEAHLSPKLRQWLAGAGMALVAIGLWIIDEKTPFPSGWAALPVVGTTAIIAAGPQTAIARALSHPLPVWIGLISYPLYLWHWPLLALTRSVAGQEISVAARCALGFLAVVLAHLTYAKLEIPLRRAALLGRTPVLASAVAIMGLLGAAVFALDGVPGRVNLEKLAFDEPKLPCPDGLKSPADARLDYCSTNRPGAPVAAFVGDSHAAHLFSAMEHGVTAPWLLVAHYSCPPVLGIEVQTDYPACRAKAAFVLNYLTSAKADSIHRVYLSLYSGYAHTEAYAAEHVAAKAGPPKVTIDGHSDGPTKLRLLEQGLSRAIATLQSASKEVVLVLDNPEFPFRPNRCAPGLPARTALSEWVLEDHSCSVSLASVQGRQEAYRALVERIRLRHPGLRVVDPLAALCTSGDCPVLRDGALLYMDSHHLSRKGAQLVVPQLGK